MPEELVCSCGAKAEPKDRKRFLKRHPAICGGSKPQPVVKVPRPVPVITDRYLYWLEQIEQHGVNLTDWERQFVADIRTFVGRQGTGALTDNKKEKLEQVYADRTP